MSEKEVIEGIPPDWFTEPRDNTGHGDIREFARNTEWGAGSSQSGVPLDYGVRIDGIIGLRYWEKILFFQEKGEVVAIESNHWDWHQWLLQDFRMRQFDTPPPYHP